MAQYLRVVRRGKHNVRVELPDHTTQLVPVPELPLWELVVALANQSQNVEVINLDQEMAEIEQNNDVKGPSIQQEEPVAENNPVVDEVNQTSVEDINEQGEVKTVIEYNQPLEESKHEEGSKEVEKPRRGRKPKSESKPKEEKPKKSDKPNYKEGNFRKNTNGLGVDHPYETVDTNVESVEYSDGVEAPF